MDVKNCFSKFKPEVWRIQSEVVKRKMREINERIEAVIEDADLQSNSDDDEDSPERGEFDERLN